MKVGDKLTVKCRFMQYSKILMRNKDYKYYDVTYQIEAIFPNSLIIKEPDNSNTQLVSKVNWNKLKKTKRNWE